MTRALAITSTLVALACNLAIYAPQGNAGESVPRAVELSDAIRPPTWMHMVRPGHTYNLTRRCLGRSAEVTDVSAYRWDGRALSAQRRDRAGWLYWKHPKGGRVEFDGCGFWNQTDRPVLVAAWRDA